MDCKADSGVQGSEAGRPQELSGCIDDVLEPQKQGPAQAPDHEAGLPPAAEDPNKNIVGIIGLSSDPHRTP